MFQYFFSISFTTSWTHLCVFFINYFKFHDTWICDFILSLATTHLQKGVYICFYNLCISIILKLYIKCLIWSDFILLHFLEIDFLIFLHTFILYILQCKHVASMIWISSQFKHHLSLSILFGSIFLCNQIFISSFVL